MTWKDQLIVNPIEEEDNINRQNLANTKAAELATCIARPLAIIILLY